MTWINTIDEKEAKGELKEIYDIINAMEVFGETFRDGIGLKLS